MVRQHCTIQFRRMGIVDNDGPVVDSGPFDITDWDGHDRDRALTSYRFLKLANPEIYAVCIVDEHGKRIFRWDAGHEIVWQGEESARRYREGRLLENSWEGIGSPFHVSAPSKGGQAKSKDFETLKEAYDEAELWEYRGFSDVLVETKEGVVIPRPPMPSKAR